MVMRRRRISDLSGKIAGARETPSFTSHYCNGFLPPWNRLSNFSVVLWRGNLLLKIDTKVSWGKSKSSKVGRAAEDPCSITRPVGLVVPVLRVTDQMVPATAEKRDSWGS